MGTKELSAQVLLHLNKESSNYHIATNRIAAKMKISTINGLPQNFLKALELLEDEGCIKSRSNHYLNIGITFKGEEIQKNEGFLKYLEEKNSIQKVQQLNKKLEIKVSERTDQLAQTVNNLIAINKQLGEELEATMTKTEFYDNIIKKYEIDQIGSLIIEIPEELKLCMQQYILFFKEYLSKAKNTEIYFEVIKISIGLRIDIKPKEINDINIINDWFNEYLDFFRNKTENFVVHFEGHQSEKDGNILMAELKNQIRHFESQLEILSLKNLFLAKEIKSIKENNGFLKKLTLNLSAKDQYLLESGNYDLRSFQLQLKNLLSKGKTNDLIEELIGYLHKSNQQDLYDELIILTSNLNRLNLESRKGIISKEEENFSRSKINNSLLGLINSI